MLWFGDPFGPICEPEYKADTPVGQLCFLCNKAVVARDQGVLIPLSTSDEILEYPYHRRCLLEGLGIDAHHRGKKRAHA